MLWLVLLLAWIMSRGSDGGEQCGGVLTASHGVLQTPHFPRRFPVPLQCRWVIDASHLANSQQSSIVVYFSQLFVSTGLTFTEFDYYEPDSTFQLGGRLIHRVTEQNVTTVQWLLTRRHYLVVDLSLNRLEGSHLRVLDGLLDVYGFNLTYEAQSSYSINNNSCSVLGCSLSGHCYVNSDYRQFSCSCFDGFSGPNCGLGPLCMIHSCDNGGTCRQAGAAAVLCICPEGFTGSRCEIPLQSDSCANEDGCTTQCPEDGSSEPCACSPNSKPVAKDRARYEGTVRLTNVSAVRSCLESATCSLKPMLTKQISKYLRNSNLSVMEDLRVIDIGFSGEMRFHFWGGRRDGSRVRESLNRLVQRGRLGNITLVPTHLAITQEPTLHLQSVSVNQRPVRQGEEFILSCFAQGSSHMMFRWFKDGVFINITQARRVMWTRILPQDSAQQFTALLGVECTDTLDSGRYTCQVTDWGYQQCKSITLQVLSPPTIRLDPITLTIEKGDNVTVKCTSPNELQQEARFGYSWTKNNALFKMTPGLEYWEDLYPGGSILRIYNAQKSATYSCHVHGPPRSVSQTARLELLNRTAVPWCEPSAPWPRAGPGVAATVLCPTHYVGFATRLCLLVDRDQAAWQTPDYSDCVSERVAAITNDFHRVTLGYGNTTALSAMLGLLSWLRDRGAPYPGEGEPVVSLLHRVITYLNDTESSQDLDNSTSFFYSVVNSLLRHRNFIINHQKVEDLHQAVEDWSRLWGAQPGTASLHLTYEALVVDLLRYDSGTVRRTLTLIIPRPTLSYPAWYSSRILLELEANKRSQNQSSSIAVVTYNHLSEFLPQRFSMVLENGSEVQYEVGSPLVAVLSQGPLRVSPQLRLPGAPRPGWQLRCALSHTPSALWNLSLCQSTAQDFNTTLCSCPQLGTFAAILVKVITPSESVPLRVSPQVLLAGCTCCLVQSLLALSLISLRWYRHRTCLLFLKLLCCFSTASSMFTFLFATSRSLPQVSYAAVSLALQASVLVSLSCHLSKALLVYTEIVYLPAVKHLRPTILCIITGVPLLVVLCNHIVLSSTGSTLSTWWLPVDSSSFYSCLACGTLIIVTFLLLYAHITRRLRGLTVLKSYDTKKAVTRRQGLLNRAALVMGATTTMASCSVVYTNSPSAIAQYLFSLSCALLGFALLLCYVLHCESPLHLHLLRTLKLDNSFSSQSDSSPLNFFTKQEAERECDGVPPRANGRAEPIREAPPILKTRSTPDCCRPTKPKAVTFHNDLVTGCTGGSCDMELYGGSPRKYPGAAMARMGVVQDAGGVGVGVGVGSARVCVITSVVVDTPSVVVCSVDVEPCAVLSQSMVVHAGVEPAPPPPPPVPAPGPAPALPEQDDGDVLDRICHDLDYLLGGLPEGLKPELPRPEELAELPPPSAASTVASPADSVQQTSL